MDLYGLDMSTKQQVAQLKFVLSPPPKSKQVKFVPYDIVWLENIVEWSAEDFFA